MSSKNSISAQDVLDTLAALPPGAHACERADPFERLRDALARRPAKAVRTRFVFYRYDCADGAGQGERADHANAVQAALTGGRLPFHDVCKRLDADVQLIEMGAGTPTREDNARAAAFGMMAAEEDTGLLVVCAFGAGAPVHAGRDFLDTATPDCAAVLGAMAAAARAGIPVIADGARAYAAARALAAARPDACAHVFVTGVAAGTADPALAVVAEHTPDHPGFAGAALASLCAGKG